MIFSFILYEKVREVRNDRNFAFSVSRKFIEQRTTSKEAAVIVCVCLQYFFFKDIKGDKNKTSLVIFTTLLIQWN